MYLLLCLYFGRFFSSVEDLITQESMLGSCLAPPFNNIISALLQDQLSRLNVANSICNCIQFVWLGL